MTLREKIYAWVYDFVGDIENATNLTNLLMYDISNSKRETKRGSFMLGFMTGFVFLYLLLKYFA